MTVFRIAKSIPPPPKREVANGASATIRRLKPGESVLIPGSSSLACSYGKRLIGKGKFTTRKEGKGHRLWRLE